MVLIRKLFNLLSLKDVKKLNKLSDLFGYFEIMHYLCTKIKRNDYESYD